MIHQSESSKGFLYLWCGHHPSKGVVGHSLGIEKRIRRCVYFSKLLILLVPGGGANPHEVALGGF
jgi:hypothetical protein